MSYDHPPFAPPGGSPGQQRPCPVCEMVLEHQPGCPCEGLSMAEAREVWKKREEEAWIAGIVEKRRRRQAKRRKRQPDEGLASRDASPPPADAGADQAGQDPQEANSKDG